jgi:hypothetical protein
MVIVRACLALSAAERRLLVRAFVSLLLVHAGLRLFGLRRLLAWAGRPAATGVSPAARLRVRHYARWIDAAARHHFVPSRCLHRSLTLHLWLRREGLPSELRIGVRKAGDALQAHAWVELGGRVVNDRAGAVAPFVPLAGAADGLLGRRERGPAGTRAPATPAGAS